MRTRVKYCGLVRPQDVDAAVAIGVDAVGFVFYPRSPRLLDIETAAALRRRLPSWVSAVGLFVNETPPAIASVVREVGLDVVQLHGDETPADGKALPTAWWKAIRIAASGTAGTAGDAGAGEPARAAILQALADFGEAEFCLLDSVSIGYGGSGRTFDWRVVPQGFGQRLIVSGGLEPTNVGAAIASLRPFGVDTSSGVQGRDPREKDVGRMEQFMEAVRRADDASATKKQ
jgi:phosphoribosylanthranilate isomerase